MNKKTQEGWYYKIDSSKQGPFSHSDLREMLQKGQITQDTQVWNSSIDTWIPLGELEHFDLATADAPPEGQIFHKDKIYDRETDHSTVRRRPWVRFWARMLDYSLFALLLVMIPSLFFVAGSLFFILVVLFIWIFIESILLSTWGTTPGKWFFKITIRTQEGNKLPFSFALRRSLSVWWLGLAAGIPIICLITLIIAAVKLSQTGKTSWDKRGDYSISHGDIAPIRTIIAILYFLCYFVIMGWFQLLIMG